MRLGILVHDGDRFDQSRVKAAIDALPQKLLPLWQELLERLPLVPGPDGWNGVIVNSAACLDPVSEMSRVVVVDDPKAEASFGLTEDEDSKMLAEHNHLEICRFVAAPRARAFADATTLSALHFDIGLGYGELWDTRFGALARAPIKTVVLVDRYAISQHYLCPQHYLSGLERFLRLLDGDATGPRYVSVFSAWTADLNQIEPHVTLEMIAEEIRQVGARLPRRIVRRVRLVMLPNGVFGNLHHDRFVRFGEYVWDLGTGIKVFEGPAVAEACAASFKCCFLAPTYKTAETALEQHGQARIVEVQL